MKEEPKQSLESQLKMARPRRHEVKRVPLTDEEKEFLGEIMDKAVAAEKAGKLQEAINFYTDYKNELVKIKEIKEIRERVKELEKSLELEKQYKDQVEILKKNGLIEKLPIGELGFVDINEIPRPIPTYKEILERVEAKKELLEKKEKQGFTQLLLVPFGMKLSAMAEKAKDLILKKYKQGNLKGTNGDNLELDEETPVLLEKKYEGGDADIRGKLFYYPESFLQNNHKGKTKKKILDQTGGWDIMLIEDLPDLPARGEGNTVGNREQLESDFSAHDYLTIKLKEEQYKEEQGMTPEAELAHFMHYLQKNNQVIDDWQGSGKANLNLGGFIKDAGMAGGTCFFRWQRDDKQLQISWIYPYDANNVRAARTLIRF